MQHIHPKRRHVMQTSSCIMKTQHFILKKRGPRFVKFVNVIIFVLPAGQFSFPRELKCPDCLFIYYFVFWIPVWLLSVAGIEQTNWFWRTSRRLRLPKRCHGRSFGWIHPKSRDVPQNGIRTISRSCWQVNQPLPYQAKRSAWSLPTSLVWNGKHISWFYFFGYRDNWWKIFIF